MCVNTLYMSKFSREKNLPFFNIFVPYWKGSEVDICPLKFLFVYVDKNYQKQILIDLQPYEE